MKVYKVIVGLGNHILPNTRHSIGMQACNCLVNKYGSTWNYMREYKAYVSSLKIQQKEILLVKSKLPMNLNGKSVKKICNVYEVDADDLFVLHDDLDRSLGKTSWKIQGSAGGHNGVKSLISCLSTDKFRRLRIGIGRPCDRSIVTDYVLSEFTTVEQDQLDEVLDKCANLLQDELVKALQVDDAGEEGDGNSASVSNNSSGVQNNDRISNG